VTAVIVGASDSLPIDAIVAAVIDNQRTQREADPKLNEIWLRQQAQMARKDDASGPEAVSAELPAVQEPRREPSTVSRYLDSRELVPVSIR